MLLEVLLVELARAGRAGAAAAPSVMSAGAIEVVDRLALRLERGALEDAGQEAGAPVLRVPLGQAAAERVVHHDERRQVLALAAQAVGDPRADAREAHAAHAGVDLEQGRASGCSISVKHEWMNAMSSTCSAMFGKDLRDPRAALRRAART